MNGFNAKRWILVVVRVCGISIVSIFSLKWGKKKDAVESERACGPVRNCVTITQNKEESE